MVRILHPSLFDTLGAVPRSESTPPLYYLAAWLWSRPFGTGEVGLRSLSALAGTASIAIVYLGAVALPLPRRAGLIAAAIVAVSPVAIWFSQDARAYALVFLLTGLSFLFFARARRSGSGTGPRLVGRLLGAGDRHPLLRRLRRLAGGRAAARGRGSTPGRHRDRGGARGGGAIAADRAATGRKRPRQLDRRTTALPTLGTGRSEAGGRRQRQRARCALRRADPARRPGGAGAGGAGAAALARRAARSGAARGSRAPWASPGWPCRCCSAPSAPTTSTGATCSRSSCRWWWCWAWGSGYAGRAGRASAWPTAFCLCSLAFAIEIDRLPRLQREDLRNAAAQVGPLRPGKARRHDPVRGQPAAALLPRWPLRGGFAAAAAKRSTWSALASRRKRAPGACCRLPSIGSSPSPSPTTSP